MLNKAIFSVIYVFIFFLLFSCEKDDVCLANGTAKIVFRFYDKTNQTIKKTNNFTLIALPIHDTILKNTKTDSISFFLNTRKNFSDFIFIEDSNIDTLHISYKTESFFISKSCGYKINFKQLNIDLIPDTDNWIHTIDIINNQIITDTSAHVKIFY